MIGHKHATAVLRIKCITHISTVFHRTIATCQQLSSDKQSKPQQRQNHSFLPEWMSQILRKATTVNRSEKESHNQIVKSSFKSKSFKGLFPGGQEVYKAFIKKSLWVKPKFNKIKGRFVMLKKKNTSDKQTDCENVQSHNTEYEQTFNNALAAFNEHSDKDNVGDTQTENVIGQSLNSAYEEAFIDALAAFNDQSVKRHVGDTQTDHVSGHSPYSANEQDFSDALAAFSDQSGKHHLDAAQIDNANDQSRNSTYEQEFSDALGAFNEQSNLYVCKMMQEMEETIDIADTNEMIIGLDLEEIIDDVIDSAVLSAPSNTAIGSTILVVSEQPNETRPQNTGTRRNCYSIYFPYLNVRNLINIFLKGKGKVKYWNLFRGRKNIGGKTSGVMLKKSFSDEETAILQQIIKYEVKEQSKMRSESKAFQSKESKEINKTYEQHPGELSQELLKHVMITVLKNKMIKAKIMRLLNRVKDNETQKKCLKIFIWLIFKFFIFPQVDELLQSMDLFSAKTDK